MMVVLLKNNKQITVRRLQETDTSLLFDYFSGLSADLRSRFAPHPFDQSTAIAICKNLESGIRYYIAIDDEGTIIAYMLVKKRMIEEDRTRLLNKNIYYDTSLTCAFAPSVADAWQNSGVGSAMYDIIEKDILDNSPWRVIVLWGGVQATNDKAIHFYAKKGFQHLGNFFANGQNNYDMVKILGN
jgi:diamine N-acetyltransferase